MRYLTPSPWTWQPGEDSSSDIRFRATGSVLVKPGFMAVYQEGKDDQPKDDQDRLLPDVKQGDVVRLLGTNCDQHFTEPPPRYSEATLVQSIGGVRHWPSIHLCVHHLDPSQSRVCGNRQSPVHSDGHRTHREYVSNKSLHPVRGLRIHSTNGRPAGRHIPR